MFMPSFASRALGALAALAIPVLTACESVPVDVTDRSLKSIPVVHLATPGIRIEARDKSFTLTSGQQAYTPFEMDIWSADATPYLPANIVNGFGAAKTAGAKDVLVYVEGRAAPLYGVLVLSKVFNAASGPGTRSYQIAIPQDKIDAAYSGVTAVVYEDVLWKQVWNSGYTVDNRWHSWVLWLSATPI